MSNDKYFESGGHLVQLLSDDSPMPYGVHKDKPMVDVPAKYLLWLWDNDKCSKSVKAYVVDNWEVLHGQAGRPLPKRR